MYKFLGRHFRESVALILSVIIAVGGLYFAWTKDPISLNRAGAAIIIIGVLLAASRFQEWVEQKAYRFVEDNIDQSVDSAIKKVEKQHGELDPDVRVSIRTKTMANISDELGRIFEADKKRIKAWEVVLVVVGTFLNGFGDCLVALVKNLVT